MNTENDEAHGAIIDANSKENEVHLQSMTFQI